MNEKPLRQSLSKRILYLRLMNGYTVSYVAKALGKAPNTIINWESGKVIPDLDIIQELCNFYKVGPNQMLGWGPYSELDKCVAENQRLLEQYIKLQYRKKQIEIEQKEIRNQLHINANANANFEDLPDDEE